MRPSVFSAFVVAAAVAIPTAQALEFRPLIGYETSTLRGDITDGDQALNLREETGLRKADDVWLGLEAGMLGQYFRVRYLPYKFSGSSTRTEDITDFAGVDFSLQTEIDSRLKLTEYAFDYRFTPINLDTFRFGIGAGVSYFDASVSLSATEQSEALSEEQTAALSDEISAALPDGASVSSSGELSARRSANYIVPTLGVVAGVGFPGTGISVTLDYSGMSVDNYRLTHQDLDLDYTSPTIINVRVGYRNRSLRVDGRSLDADVSLKGPYAALWFGF